MKILSFGFIFGHRRRLRRHGATCRTSPSSVSPRMPSRSKVSTKREAAEWMGFGGCLFGKKIGCFLGFCKGMQGKLWDFTRKNGEVIKINYIDLIWCCLNIGYPHIWWLRYCPFIDKPTRMITVGSYFDVYSADSVLDVVCSNIINSTIIVPPDFNGYPVSRELRERLSKFAFHPFGEFL